LLRGVDDAGSETLRGVVLVADAWLGDGGTTKPNSCQSTTGPSLGRPTSLSGSEMILDADEAGDGGRLMSEATGEQKRDINKCDVNVAYYGIKSQK
jgi:hypothetical protein